MHHHSHHTQNQAVTSNRIGAWVSIACAIHCAAMPFLLTVLPLLGMEFLASHLFEVILLSAGLGFGAYGILRAYFRQHRDAMPVIMLVAGASVIVVGMFIGPESMEHVLVPVGAVTVGIAQVVNIRKSRTCAVC